MGTKSRARPKEASSRRTEGMAKRQLKRTSRERESQDRGAVGQDERLIGAERFPRKGDDEQEP